MASSSSATSVVSSSVPSATPVVSSSVPSATSVISSTVSDSTFSVTTSLPSVSSTLFGLSPSFDIVSLVIPNLSSVAALATPNVTNLVTIKLSSAEDYLTWCTQFTSLLISHELMGFVDGSIPPPSPLLSDVSRNPQPNPLYRSWIKIDQSVRSWLFATLSRDVLLDVHLLPTSRDIWLSLQRCYMDASQAKFIELKHQLTTLQKDDNMSSDHYLRNAKQIDDSLAAINALVASRDFIDHVLFGLGKEYDTLVGIIMHFPGQLSIEELRTKLLLHEQRLQRFKDLDSPTMHQAFAAHSVSTTTPQDSSTQFVYAHMTPSEGNLLHKTPYTGHNRVLVGDGKLLNISNIGYTQLPSTSRPLHMRSVFHVPQLKHNLISVKKLRDDNNCVVNFDSSSISVKDKASGQTLLRESSKGDVYPLSSKSLCSHPQALVAVQQSGDVWHRRLGHCGARS
ncbi:hypothetical protein FXO37_07936 [Capsicum annuum]|nr:hypothetical protein FXO37_07936 [Capsicum annuum]